MAKKITDRKSIYSRGNKNPKSYLDTVDDHRDLEKLQRSKGIGYNVIINSALTNSNPLSTQNSTAILLSGNNLSPLNGIGSSNDPLSEIGMNGKRVAKFVKQSHQFLYKDAFTSHAGGSFTFSVWVKNHTMSTGVNGNIALAKDNDLTTVGSEYLLAGWYDLTYNGSIFQVETGAGADTKVAIFNKNQPNSAVPLDTWFFCYWLV